MNYLTSSNLVLCKSNANNGLKVKLGILLRENPCFEQYYSLDNSVCLHALLFKNNNLIFINFNFYRYQAF